MEDVYVNNDGQARISINIPYSLDKSEETLLRAACDCKLMLINSGKGQGTIEHLNGTDFTPGVSYSRSLTVASNKGTESVHDKMTLTKIEGKRVEYAVISTENGKPHRWTMVVLFGHARSPRGSPVVEIQYLNRFPKIECPAPYCCCNCLGNYCLKLDCIIGIVVNGIKNTSAVMFQDMFNTYQYTEGQDQSTNQAIPFASISSPNPVDIVNDESDDMGVKRF